MAKLHCEHLQQDIDQFLQSTAEEMVYKTAIQQEMVGKWSIKPTLAEKLADIIIFIADKEEVRTEQIVSQLALTETTAKRYLRQLTELGYLEAHGGNRNKSYTRKVGSAMGALPPFGGRFPIACPRTVRASLPAYGSPLVMSVYLSWA